MKLMILFLGFAVAGAAYAAETQVQELRQITKVSEFEKGDTVIVKSGLRLVSTRNDSTVQKSGGSCVVSMESPVAGAEAFFDTDSEWRVRKTYSVGPSRYIYLENIDNVSKRDLKVYCVDGVDIEELKKVDIEILSAHRSVKVLRFGRQNQNKTSDAKIPRSWNAYSELLFSGGL